MKITSTLDFLSRPRNLWGVIFFYTLVSGLFVQLVLLPFIAPSWHKSHGLIRDMDGIKFHSRAVEVSNAIKTDGWGSWQLMPDGLVVSGVAAVFYTLIYPEPWAMLPLNSALNASAGLAFFFLLSFFIADKRRNLIATLPFIFFPSAFLWNTQLNNEFFVIPGIIFILLGWVMLINLHPNELGQKTSDWMGVVMMIGLAGLLILLARSQALIVAFAVIISAAIGINLYWLVQTLRKKISLQSFFAHLFVIWLACLAMYPGPVLAERYLHSIQPKVEDDPAKQSQVDPEQLVWETTPWLPSALEQQIKQMIKKRMLFVTTSSDAGSMLDVDVSIRSATDVIQYIPRALQIGLLSPFPNLWFEQAGVTDNPWLTDNPSRTFMRLESALETVFSYLCLLGLPILVWKQRRQPALFLVLAICLTLIMVYAISLPNQGALYRLRYPQFMTLVCLGLAGWMSTKPLAAVVADTQSATVLKIAISATTSWNLYNSRLNLARALAKRGHDVIMLSPRDEFTDFLLTEQFRWVNLTLRPRSKNPLHELAAIGSLIRFYLAERPDLANHFTPKGVIYGSLAAKISGVKRIVNTITGLGAVFSNEQARWLQTLITFLYRVALTNTTTIFQNPDDQKLFEQRGLVKSPNSLLVPGSGIDVEKFIDTPEPDGPPVILLPSRFVEEKGIRYFVEASRLLQERRVTARFVLVGRPEDDQPTAITSSEITQWMNEGVVEWWGWHNNMEQIYPLAHIVCLPTYYMEGIPKSLIEAAACGRPLVATDVPGCREIVHHGENGLLVQPKNVRALADAIEKLVKDADLRKAMGAKSRQLAVDEFSKEKVIAAYLKVYGIPD